MFMKPYVICVAVALTVFSCETKKSGYENPPSEGFDQAHSDPAAVELADSIMFAMGGRENWDKTHFISWNFFGRRNWVWDKQSGRIRIESINDSTIYLANVNTDEGRVQVKGQELTEPDSLRKMLKRAKSMYYNDMYWLAMPFKLKDGGVTLKYMGEDTLKGTRFNVLQLMFKEVGDTPQNKYRLYVDVKDKLVRYWSYYADHKQDTANFTRPWDNYQKYGNILLSGDRSDGAGPKSVRVEEAVPEKTFTEFQ
jgi:hypothetical protein